jgi:hypothetical protein
LVRTDQFRKSDWSRECELNCHAEYNSMVRNCGKFFSSFYSYLFLRQFPQVSVANETNTRIMRSKISGNFVPSRCITNDNIISDIVEPNIPDTIANIKQKSLHGRYFKELEQPEINIQASHAWLKKSNIHSETEGFIFAIQDRVINTRNYKKHICGLQSIIDKCRICGTEGETIEHIISSCTVLAQSEYKKRHDIFAKIIHMNLAVKFNLLT